ncbi:T9SS type A sorting domain-containing protein [bacterium]|nr:T9SS type A sorting domain-containing protein [bacterium]
MKHVLTILGLLLPLLVLAQQSLEFVGTVHEQPSQYVRHSVLVGNRTIYYGDGLLGVLVRTDTDSLYIESRWNYADYGEMRDMVVAFPYVFVLVGGLEHEDVNVFKLDYTDPAYPTVVGRHEFDFDGYVVPWRLMLYGGYLYASLQDRLVVMNANSTGLAVLANRRFGRCEEAEVIGDYLVCAFDRRIVSFSLADPRDPQPVADVEYDSGTMEYWLVNDDYFYRLTGDEGIEVYDASDPESIHLAGTSSWGTSIASRSRVIQGNMLYMIDFWNLYYVSLADPVHPEVVYTVESPWQIETSTHLGATGVPGELFVFNQLGKLVALLDISQPNQIHQLHPWSQIEGFIPPTGLYLGDDLLISTSLGFTIYDVSNRLHPVKVGQQLKHNSIQQVDFSGNTMFVASALGLYSADLSDPADPVRSNWTRLPDVGASGVAVRGDLVCAARSGSNLDCLYHYNLANPTNPVLIANYGYSARSLFFDGPTLFGVKEYGAPFVFSMDTSNPLDPVVLGSQTVAVAEEQSDLRDSVLAVPKWRLGLELIDTRDPVNLPSFASYSPPADSVGPISLAGGYLAYGSPQGVRLLDIRDPYNPQLVATYEHDREITAIRMLESGLIYASDYRHILILNAAGVMDVSPPPANVAADLDDDDGTVLLTWEPPGGGAEPVEYEIEQDGELLVAVTGFSYANQLPVFGEYEYTVRAVYPDGASVAVPELVDWAAPTPVTLERLSSPIILPAGGQLRLRSTVTSALPVDETVALTLLVEYPGGGTELLCETAVVLAPGQTIEFDSIVMRVPGYVLEGLYRLRVEARIDNELTGIAEAEFSKLLRLDLPASRSDGWSVTGFGDEAVVVAGKGAATQPELAVEVLPNPFNDMCRVRVQLPEQSPLAVMVYNIQGRQVARLHEGAADAGVHEFAWDASRFASGLYFLRVDPDGRSPLTRKLLLVK